MVSQRNKLMTKGEEKTKKPLPKVLNKPKKKPESSTQPTRFGDWQVKGRCIDF